jgi:parvulin-like peptidyl-prolyl isomerase
MKRLPGFALILISLTIYLSSCSSSPETVAIVNGEKLPMSMINNYFKDMGMTWGSADDEFEDKKMAVDSLIDYKLLVKGAYDQGLDLDKEIEKIVDSQRSTFLFDELYRQDILPKTKVTDQEVEDFLEKTKTEYRFSHILVDTKELADSLYDQLKSGVDFAMVARQFSQDQSSAVKGGDIGFLNWGRQIDPDFREAAFALQVGEMSEPVHVSGGWDIIRNEESRPASTPPAGVELDYFAREIIRQRKSMVAEMNFWDELERKANVQVNPEATDLLLEKLKAFYPDTVGGVPRPTNFFPNPDLLQPFERQMVIASFTGGEMTIDDYLDQIANVDAIYRPSFADRDSLQKIIFQLELKNIVEFQADQRQLEDTPEYQRRVKDFREGLMVEKFKRTNLMQGIDVDEDEITDYYNSHLEDFMTEPEYHLIEIENDSIDLLKDLTRQANMGADFSELAAKYTTRPGFKEKKGDLGMVPSFKYPSLYSAAKTLQIGGISPVVKNVRGHYSIVKLVEATQPKVRPIEDCQNDVRQKILKTKRDNAVANWLEKARPQADIQVFEDVIRDSIDKSKYEKS